MKVRSAACTIALMAYLQCGHAQSQCPNTESSTTKPTWYLTSDTDPQLIRNPPNGQWFHLTYTPTTDQPIRLILFRDDAFFASVLPSEDRYLQWPGGGL